MAYKEHQLVPSDGGVAERPRFICDVQDVIEEILPRLPVKSLLRFRCVCKSWRALISASLFAKKHLGHAAVTSRLQIFEFGSGEYEPGSNVANLKVASRQLDVPRWCSADVHSVSLAQASTRTICIVGSCNGLICLQVSRGLFLLWNPCTRETKMLPQRDTPRGGWTFYGFGYDSAGEDYKVIVGALYERYIHSVKTGSWRKLEGLDEPVHFQIEGNIGCLFNGALHWLGFKEEEGTYSVEIISFDLAEEEFQAVLPLPTRFPKTYRSWSSDGLGIGTGTSKTGLFVYHYDHTKAFTIWTKEDEYKAKKCWTKVLKIPFEIFMRYDRIVSGDYRVSYITILENGAVLICWDCKKVVLYRPEREICTTVFDSETQKLGKPGARAGYIMAIMCLETLVSPKSCFSSSPSV